MLVCEEVLDAHPGMTGTYDDRIRADMVDFTTRKDGAVFSPGSIAWGQALPIDGLKNNVSTIMKNVVDAFAKPGRLPGQQRVSEEKQWRWAADAARTPPTDESRPHPSKCRRQGRRAASPPIACSFRV
jgi:hypothetical protein